MRESLQELLAAYSKSVGHRTYNYLHIILMLVLYEVLIFFSSTSEIALFNGMDIWFHLFYLIPMRSLPVSILVMIVLGFYAFLDINGIKDQKERKARRIKEKG